MTTLDDLAGTHLVTAGADLASLTTYKFGGRP